MEVDLGDSLLSSQGPDMLLLVAICAFGYMGRHRIIPGDRGRWEQWAQQLPPTLADELRHVWEEGERQAAIGVVAERVEVRAEGLLKLAAGHVSASPQDAFALLSRPLRVLLENGRNDRLFMLAFADALTRKAIEQAEDAGWLVFETAGGIGELKVRLEQQHEIAMIDAIRMMYLCDSDGREPGEISTEATTVRQGLESLAGRHDRDVAYFGHVLHRRSAENYAPPREVLIWAKAAAGPEAWQILQRASDPRERVAMAQDPSKQDRQSRYLRAAIALKELPRDVRAFLDMKEGRGEAPFRTADAIWERLDDFQKSALKTGFGSKFAAHFYGQARHLPDETGEVVALLKRVLERL